MGLHETYNFKFCAKTNCKNATKARYDYVIKILIGSDKNWVFIKMVLFEMIVS